MKGFKCLLLGLLFVVSSIGLSIGLSDRASAASAYDDVVETMPYLTVEIGNYSNEWNETLDISTDWSNLFTDTGTHFRGVYEYTSQCSTVNFDDLVARTGDDGDLYMNVSYSKSTYTDNINVTFLDKSIYPNLSFETLSTSKVLGMRGSGYPTTYAFTASFYRLGHAQSGKIDHYCYSNAIYGASSTVAREVISTGINDIKPWIVQSPIDYPAGYAGQIPPTTWSPPEVLVPEYIWTVNETGKLNVQYTKNLEYFLTGISWLVVDETSEDWLTTVSEIDNITVMPAGWLNEDVQLSGAGYYRIRIDHNQQLDSPPWPSDEFLSVAQIWVEIYWDGKSVITGNTIGCSGSAICNDFRDTRNPILDAIDKVSVDDHGLQSLIYSPIEFLGGLFNITENCSPITIPFVNSSMTLNCVRPMLMSSPFAGAIVIAQYIITGLVMYWVSIRTFSVVKNASDPQNDRIEVLKL